LAALILFAELALLLFAFVPPPYNIVLLFLNGLPLGMVWGVVFSYLEGRRSSELLGAGLSASFIVSSGAVKTVGKLLMQELGITEFWMPFFTGLVFLLPFFFFVYLLERIPPPTAADIAARTERLPMNRAARLQLFRTFAFGLVMLIVFYMALTAYRDFRDNFAAEIWQALGYGDAPYIFTLSEIPIALAVLLLLGLLMLIRHNRRAFLMYQLLIMASAALIGLSTWLFQMGWLPAAAWMILVGLGLYLAYVPFNCILFDRMLAAYEYRGNAGFLIYLADAFGYLGSVGILFYKNFGQARLSWLQFFIQSSYLLAGFGILTVGLSWAYFRQKKINPPIQSPALAPQA
ncbi:MAG: hypothetical protein HC913_17655, partial [Microscillaceae bacterium]|nr:hypothetical protein [Microscillaceae bacterium]